MYDVVCLIAPTASGKTDLAYELYDTGRYYLISVDSALIYRDMNIGTAKPSIQELERYPHALVDIINPDESYSVAQFVDDVAVHIGIAHSQGKTPLLVGGTMMYYMALLEGIANIPATLPQTRQQVNDWIAQKGIQALHDYLTQVDPVLAQRLNPTDTQRIGRAVEIYLQTNRPLSAWQQDPTVALVDKPHQHWHIFVVTPDRAWLHNRIAQRLDNMWHQGFIEEVIELRGSYDLDENMPSMRCVGYRQVWDYLEKVNKINKDQEKNILINHQHPITLHQPNTNRAMMELYRQTMQNEALYATRQLAKRQYTWMRKLINLHQQHPKYGIQQLTTVQDVHKFL